METGVVVVVMVVAGKDGVAGDGGAAAGGDGQRHQHLVIVKMSLCKHSRIGAVIALIANLMIKHWFA